MASKRLLIPKEHGAWATLVMALVVGVGVAGQIAPEAFLFLIAAVSVFAGRYPLSLLMKGLGYNSRGGGIVQRQRTLWLAGYAAMAGASAAILIIVYARYDILALGFAGLILLAVQTVLQRCRRDRTVPGELLAFGGLTLTAPGAYYVTTGIWDMNAASAWLLTFLYAGASIFYVKMKVKQRGLGAADLDFASKARFGFEIALYVLAVVAILVPLATAGQVPALALIAFVPLIYKVLLGTFRIASELNLRRIGFIELAHSCVFTSLLIAAYGLS